MIASIPGGATLAAVLLCWLGATAPVGRHVRPGRLARLARAAWETRMGWPVHAVDDLDDDADDEWSGLSPDEYRARFAALSARYANADAAVSLEDWRQAMLRIRAPRLFGAAWFDDTLAEFAEWAGQMWDEIWSMKREAGIDE